MTGFTNSLHSNSSILSNYFLSLALCTMLLLLSNGINAQTTAFSYQGKLTDTTIPATGTYDFEFALYDSSPTIVGTPIQRNAVVVTNGIFSVSLDFGSTAFPGADRLLEIRVKRPADTAYTPLTPRQAVVSSPYSVRARSSQFSDLASQATNATNATNAQSASFASNSNFATVAGSATNATNVTGVVGIANGGTGSSTQNFVDTTTNQNISGSKYFFDVGGNGSALSNVVIVQALGGDIGNVAAPTPGYVFLGLTANMTVASGHKLTATASAALAQGFTSPSVAILMNLCSRVQGSTSLVAIGVDDIFQVGPLRIPYTISKTFTLNPGTYDIGFCVINGTSTALNNNGKVSGWVMRTR